MRKRILKQETFLKYGINWSISGEVEIEIAMIRKGGYHVDQGNKYGIGLLGHYKAMQTLLWPEDEHNRWSDLILSTILSNGFTTVIGPKNSSKTRTCSKYALCDYFAFPNETTILISSTDMRGLELRIWGDIKSLVRRAREICPWLPGHVIEGKHAISTDSLEEDGAIRDLRSGLICVPVLSSSGTMSGAISKFVGTKNKRVRLIGDEIQFCPIGYLEIPSNLDGNPDFKGVFLGNPLDPLDALGRAAEPLNGWPSVGEPKKTTTWKSRFLNSTTINLVGTDSPNFDYPQDQPPRFPFIINKATMDGVSQFYGENSAQWYSQCIGIMKTGVFARRVLTRDICEQFHAFDDVVWDAQKRTRIYAVDVAYGFVGGDRCVAGFADFGKTIDGKVVLSFDDPKIVPVTVRADKSPEDQIAEWVMMDCKQNDVPPGNVFYDSTGRGSMGTAFARIWSADVNPVEFGGQATDRPVCSDMYIYDHALRNKRLKKCSEHFSKRVTEFWFQVRYAIESNQVRNFKESMMLEFSQREYKIVRSDKIEIETKADMKLRTGKSPDIADFGVVLMEGARRLGFQVDKMSNPAGGSNLHWLHDLREKSRAINTRAQLNYSA